MSHKKIRLLLVHAFAFATVLWLGTGQAHAATITVDDTSSAGSPTTCSLTSAIRAANTNAVVDGCTAGDPAATATDVVSLGTGTYGLDLGYTNSFTEPATLEGASKDTSIVDLTGLTDPLVSLITTPAGATTTIRNTGFTAGTLRLDHSIGAALDVVLQNLNLSPATLVFSLQNGSGDISVSDIAVEGINFFQTTPAAFTTTVRDSTIGTNGFNIENASTSAGDITIIDSELTGSGGVDSFGVFHLKTADSSAKVTIQNSQITGYETGVVNAECAIPQATFSVSTTYILNSSVGGNGMRVGAKSLCGHLVMQNSTFYDIDGSALLVYTNVPLRDPLDNSISTDPLQRGASIVESYNCTYVDIRPDGSSMRLLQYGPSGSIDETTPLDGLVVLYTNTGPGIKTDTGSSVHFDHDTFAATSLGSYSNLAFTNPAVLDDVVIRNNALEGKVLSGSYTASGTNTVADNFTTGSAVAGFTHVAGFVLGAFTDNGGIAPIGVQGRLGNVRTLRPLAGSPLIDAVHYVGLDEDQRNVHRSVLGAYDAGAIEVTLAEYTADGGVWSPGGGALENTGLPIVYFAAGASILIASAARIYTRRRRIYRNPAIVRNEA